MAGDDRVNTLRERVARFPEVPGVSLMKDAQGRMLYARTAKDLRRRVSSYIQLAAYLPASRVLAWCCEGREAVYCLTARAAGQGTGGNRSERRPGGISPKART